MNERWSVLSRVASAALVIVAAGAPRAASAEESLYCRKVNARAASDAAVLVAPAVEAQGLKFPTSGRLDTGVGVGNGYQVRTGLSVSPLDIYKGTAVLRVGEADCRRHEATVDLQKLLSESSDYGRLPALNSEAEFLDSKRAAVEAVVTTENERLAAKLITIAHAYEVQSRQAALARRREVVRGEIERIEARRQSRASLKELPSLIENAEAASMTYEHAASHVRSLDPWKVSVSGGVVPHETPLDYYGFILISFNLGAFSRNAQETNYRTARADEIRSADYELRAQFGRLMLQLKSTFEQTQRELAIVDGKLAWLESSKRNIAGVDAAAAPHALALLDLDLVAAEAERTFLRTLAQELSYVQEKKKK